MEKTNFRLTGALTKTNRKTGEITVLLEKNQPAIENDLKYIFIEIDGGMVPFAIAEIGVVSPEYFRVLLQDYSEPDRVQRFIGCKVFLPSSQTTPTSKSQLIDFDEIIGYKIYNENNTFIGIVKDVLESPEQKILQIFRNKKEILIPLVDEFILGFDQEQKNIHLDLPYGLVDLYLEN